MERLSYRGFLVLLDVERQIRLVPFDELSKVSLLASVCQTDALTH
jgi:hypothetical protein